MGSPSQVCAVLAAVRGPCTRVLMSVLRGVFNVVNLGSSETKADEPQPGARCLGEGGSLVGRSVSLSGRTTEKSDHSVTLHAARLEVHGSRRRLRLRVLQPSAKAGGSLWRGEGRKTETGKIGAAVKKTITRWEHVYIFLKASL